MGAAGVHQSSIVTTWRRTSWTVNEKRYNLGHLFLITVVEEFRFYIHQHQVTRWKDYQQSGETILPSILISLFVQSTLYGTYGNDVWNSHFVLRFNNLPSMQKSEINISERPSHEEQGERHWNLVSSNVMIRKFSDHLSVHSSNMYSNIWGIKLLGISSTVIY